MADISYQCEHLRNITSQQEHYIHRILDAMHVLPENKCSSCTKGVYQLELWAIAHTHTHSYI